MVDAIGFLGPRHGGVEAAQSGFDMGDRDPRRKARHRPAKRTRRIALHHQQRRWIGQHVGKPRRDGIGMGQRVAPAGAVDRHPIEAVQTVIGGVDWMLAGEQQAQAEAGFGKGSGDGRKLDRFRAGSDHKVDTRVMHSPPSSAVRSWIGEID